MSQYITVIAVVIALIIIFIISLIMRNREKEVRIIVNPSEDETEANIYFNGYTKEQQTELLNLLRFEVMGIENKLDDYGKNEKAESKVLEVKRGDSSKRYGECHES